MHALELLTNNTELSLRELAALLGISARSLASCKSSGLFAVQDSDRILRIAAVFEKALELFDGEALAAMQWMRQPQKALGGEIPIARSGSQLGAREVENLIGRLGEGVYS